MKVSIVVPTYNERDNIPRLVHELHEVLGTLDFDVIIVDDDSPDETWRVAKGLKQKYPCVQVIRRLNEHDLSTAVMEGFRHSTGDILGVMDADLQHPPAKMKDMIQKIQEGNDIVVGSRYTPGGEIEEWGLIRRLYSRIATLLTHILVPKTRVSTDPLSGFFALKKSVVETGDLKPRGFKILLEILGKGTFRDVADEPIKFRKRDTGKSSLRMGVIGTYIRQVVRLSWETGEIFRIAKFMAVGITGVFVNLGVLWALTEQGHLHYLVSALGGIEVSIISNFVLNDLWTFKDRKKTGGHQWLGRLLRFNVISLPAFPMQLGVMGFLKEAFGVYYLLAAFIGILIVFIWNFIANSLWTWAQPR